MKRFESLLRLLPAVPLLFASCSGSAGQRPLRLVVLDPGHFHASLLQKNALAELSDTVRVYAPEGEEVEQYLAAVASYNGRAEEPTSWREVVYTGPDYLERMVGERAGDLVVLAGNNRKKTGYILASVKAGYHVLSDKPLAVCREDFDTLRAAYAEEMCIRDRTKSASTPRRNYLLSLGILAGMFFIFGAVSWVNSILIPYFRICCELKMCIRDSSGSLR